MKTSIFFQDTWQADTAANESLRGCYMYLPKLKPHDVSKYGTLRGWLIYVYVNANFEKKPERTMQTRLPFCFSHSLKMLYGSKIHVSSPHMTLNLLDRQPTELLAIQSYDFASLSLCAVL